MEALRQTAEERCASELAALQACDPHPRPPRWNLSPRAVETFILGSTDPVGGVAISPKYVGDPGLVQVAIATLASDRGLLLLGEPGTAKSRLSEHLAAAISGSSELLVQGTAGTTEDHLKYGWNYALLLSQGPSESAIVPSPVYRAMEAGRIVRVEEITRILPEIQDALISILSEKSLAIPELRRSLHAAPGFNAIATANTRDRGVNEMSSALRRRFNFVRLPVLEDLETEMAVVTGRLRELQTQYDVASEVPPDLVRVLTTLFQELRRGRTHDGRARVRSPASILSTAELIGVLFHGAILARQFGHGRMTAEDAARSLAGAVAKENDSDLGVLREYLETVAPGRTEPAWKEFRAAAGRIAREEV